MSVLKQNVPVRSICHRQIAQPLSVVILGSHSVCPHAAIVSLVVSSHLDVEVVCHHHSVVPVTPVRLSSAAAPHRSGPSLPPPLGVWHVELDH